MLSLHTLLLRSAFPFLLHSFSLTLSSSCILLCPPCEFLCLTLYLSVSVQHSYASRSAAGGGPVVNDNPSTALIRPDRDPSPPSHHEVRQNSLPYSAQDQEEEEQQKQSQNADFRAVLDAVWFDGMCMIGELQTAASLSCFSPSCIYSYTSVVVLFSFLFCFLSFLFPHSSCFVFAVRFFHPFLHDISFLFRARRLRDDLPCVSWPAHPRDTP